MTLHKIIHLVLVVAIFMAALLGLAGVNVEGSADFDGKIDFNLSTTVPGSSSQLACIGCSESGGGPT